MSFFSVKNLSAGYASTNILNNISFEIEAGSLTGIIGANGSGKTTLLKSVCGILSHEGVCTLDGKNLEQMSPRQKSILCSYIPQRSGISIDISVLDVVLMGFNPKLGLLEAPSGEMKEKGLNALNAVGLLNRAHDNYLHLSEGQKQLCILARTLVSDCSLLLLDEPESSLDFQFRYQLLTLLKGYISEEKRSAIVSLHDPSLALNYCDSLILLKDGKIPAIISPKTDTIDKMEETLNMIYGSISLQKCVNKKGQSCLVMLKEE